jgi:hypothetical protein
MLDTLTIISKEGAIDAEATLSAVNYHTPFCLAPNDGNYYGAYIGVSRDLMGPPGPYSSAVD